MGASAMQSVQANKKCKSVPSTAVNVKPKRHQKDKDLRIKPPKTLFTLLYAYARAGIPWIKGAKNARVKVLRFPCDCDILNIGATEYAV
jgi:hypothetical protein